MISVFSDYFNKKLLSNIKDHVASGNYSGVYYPTNVSLILLKAAALAAHNTPLGTLTALEADFTGYAAFTPPVLLAERQLTDGSYQISSDIASFVQTAATISNTVYGYVVTTSADSGQWLWMANFDVPIVMAAADRAIQMSLLIQMGPNGFTAGANLL